MIVPGEASESDEDIPKPTTTITSASVRPTSISLQQQQQQLPPHRLGLASQFTSTVSSMTEAMGKQLGNLSRQATLDGVMGVVTGEPSPNADHHNINSLLHQKLFEKNLSLKKRVVIFGEDQLGQISRRTSDWANGYNRTQALMQDAVLSMQQANHFNAEVEESIEDFLDWGKRIKWPV